MRFQNFEKSKLAMRYFLQGRKYHLALKALDFAEKYHVGVRKDGISHEFSHQISQAGFVRTLENSLLYPEETIATVFLHDVVEDYDVSKETIDNVFGTIVGTAVELMTNKHSDGSKKNKDAYYRAMADNAICSITKPIDRKHNHQTMVGVFSPDKQIRYMDETSEHILPMMKIARKIFTSQEAAYLNISTVLKIQMELIKNIHQ
jgi:(p)ppGpp synthase/HD superfamily hydrolase